MAICPSCQAQIEIGSEFYGGLFTCPSCRAVYFIGFDGTPEAAQSSAQPTANYSPQPYPQEPVPQIPDGIPQIPDYNANPDQSSGASQDFNAPLGESINNSMQPMNQYEQQPNYDQQGGYDQQSQPVSYEQPTGESPTPPVFSPLKDVVDFANSDGAASLAHYAVEISGLDSVQNIQAFKEVLSDSKLQMNYEQYKPQIKNGILRIEKLTAAQAAVIAFRLRPMPLEMKWEQSLS